MAIGNGRDSLARRVNFVALNSVRRIVETEDEVIDYSVLVLATGIELRPAGVSGLVEAGTMNLSPLVYAWLVAAFIRVATGSATVAITTAAGTPQ